jgi:hypothetical protein
VSLLHENLLRTRAALGAVAGAARQCVWGNDASAAQLRAEFGGFDAVVAAGCTYHTGLLPALFRTISGLLADEGRLYVCHARREHAPSIPCVNATKRANAVHGFWRGSRRLRGGGGSRSFRARAMCAAHARPSARPLALLTVAAARFGAARGARYARRRGCPPRVREQPGRGRRRARARRGVRDAAGAARRGAGSTT